MEKKGLNAYVRVTKHINEHRENRALNIFHVGNDLFHGNKDNPYVPLYCFDKFYTASFYKHAFYEKDISAEKELYFKKFYRMINHYEYGTTKYTIRSLMNEKNLCDLLKYIIDMVDFTDIRNDKYFESVNEKIKRYISSPVNYKIPHHFINAYKYTFKAVISNFYNGKNCMMGGNHGNTYISLPYYLGKVNGATNLITHLAMVVTKPEYIPYIRACYVSGNLVNPKILELWENPAMEYESIRKSYIRDIKKYFVKELDCKWVLKQDFKELYKTYKFPKCNSFEEHEALLEKHVKEFINYAKTKDYENRNIEAVSETTA